MPLTTAQQGLLDTWLPGHTVLDDHSWGLVSTTVLRVRHRGRDLTVKASSPDDHHLAREVAAHRELTAPLLPDRAPTLVRADLEARLLVATWLPGHLVQGTAAEQDPESYRQAGLLLSRLHGQSSRRDDDWLEQQQARTRRWLARPHRIPRARVGRVERRLTRWPVGPVTLTPTHGDYHPRNWVVDHGTVSVIDFGRAQWRPAATDLARMEPRQWREDPRLEAAFLDGYGADPRPAWWRDLLLAEAVGTAVWAYQVGDEAFEQEGLRQLAELTA
ncbi:phosphotransferase [uncultured Serinicoccus sp.]|uniref:phosphotransferase n=1 Tax=uncultured Serinicoccus sp. TaxID=735514 RepID=UPI00260D1861|nr:phosphotransferase [uncultured Serinicoccus sp.]